MLLQSTNSDFNVNFGQKPFKFPPPDGFQPLNTANTRPVKVISRPDQYVGVATYTGNDATSQSINLGFKPDFVWFKKEIKVEHHSIDMILFVVIIFYVQPQAEMQSLNQPIVTY